ncbi:MULTISPECIES: DUF4236 domain-containing protein [Elizabethkingia]|uniref:DUF4236 domain-containing protein n=1 Tax=Elizabethkingia meningoseptica TaxID=238 RepID=A0A1T3FK26_ELIME|nr:MULTISPECIES: DUF4236 domain-containing protein [Elizabethkingia]AQX13744.1 hypothetical protein BBD35_15795 [Elizabethkingia meningoseptica]MBG0515542.1 DUF4236 domain-containing protein [Elizabethkingia meningoseptica]MDE5434091.1 DUF4236 domain-containing protein [Elizabethkingia meningoseptica]MDE5480963.1 DUF4236 domain-containing protein [Elizabethkingia meningoseptica]MDE5536687.1 DUF4236 domain-containing protein [Elizabethkingia meningoseptica]
MAWSFRKRVKIIPGIHLNFSKKGISTTIGVKGASLNIGSSGSYLNTSISGLGLYNRQKLPSNSTSRSLPLLQPETYITSYGNIFSADLLEITSQNMQGVKEAIILAYSQRSELNRDLYKIQKTLRITKYKKILSYIFLYGIIKKSIPQELEKDIILQREAIKQIQEQIKRCFVNIDIEFEEEIKQKFDQVYSTFKNLMVSQKIWDITSAHYQDAVKARSSVNTLVKKRLVKFSLRPLPYIKMNYDALYFQNANGADIYFYPGFIVMFSNKDNFAVIGINEINLDHNYVRFTETGVIPSDTKIIDRTWAKVNKNGTRDKRFKGNYQIPVVRYGEIRLKTSTGLNEEYEFSNYEATYAFGVSFKEYQRILQSLKEIIHE